MLLNKCRDGLKTMQFDAAQTSTDDHGNKHYLVRKRDSTYELSLLRQSLNFFLLPRLYDWCVLDDGSCVLEFEFLEEICFQTIFEYKFISRERNMNHHILEAAVCALHLFSGLWHLHEIVEIVHSKISTRSIMYSIKDELWKIVNFDQAMPVDKSLCTVRVAGTETYCPPEIVLPGIFTESLDVFSLGLVLFEIWFRPLALSIDFGCGDRRTRPLFFRFAAILKRIFNSAPADRPSARQVVRQFHAQYHKASVDFPMFRFKAADKVLPLIRQITDAEPPEVLMRPKKPRVMPTRQRQSQSQSSQSLPQPQQLQSSS